MILMIISTSSPISNSPPTMIVAIDQIGIARLTPPQTEKGKKGKKEMVAVNHQVVIVVCIIF